VVHFSPKKVDDLFIRWHVTATNFPDSLLLPDHSYFYQRQLFLMLIHRIDLSSIDYFPNYYTVRRRIHFLSVMNMYIIFCTDVLGNKWSCVL